MAVLPGVSSADLLPLGLAVDISGDGRDDFIMYDANNYQWSAISLEGNSILSRHEFGGRGVLPLAGYFLDSNRAQLSYYHPLRGIWAIQDALDGEGAATLEIDVELQRVPLVGRFEGRGRDALALFDPLDGTWMAINVDGAVLFEGKSFGWSGLSFAAGDTDGDGIDEIIAYDETQGLWMIWSPTSTESIRELRWSRDFGNMLVRDFNGSGRQDLGLWTNDGKLFVIDAQTGEAIALAGQFGDYYAIPSHAAYEGLGAVNLSYFAVGNGVWWVKLNDGRVITPNRPAASNWGM
jgi:hypothetical protein